MGTLYRDLEGEQEIKMEQEIKALLKVFFKEIDTSNFTCTMIFRENMLE